MKAQPDPSMHQKTLLCLLCLFWNGSLVQSTIINTSEVLVPTIITIPDEPSAYGNNKDFQGGPSADDQLIPFQEECVAHVIHVVRDDGHHTELRCTLPNGLSYRIPSADETWINERMVLGELISAETIVTLPPDAMLNQYTHEIQMTEPPKLWNYELEQRERRRKLRRLATTGERTVLVVRVTSSDGKTTTPTTTELGTYVFGDNGNTFNLKVQTAACSDNQLTLVKASARTGTSASISNGITSISVNAATTAGTTVMQNEITTELNSQFGVTNPSQLANHVMYCFPPGTTTGIGYAEVGGSLAMFNDNTCIYPSAQMHEVGHNYGLEHSSDSTNLYGDQTGYMGHSFESTTYGYMCYNAAKSWQLGWYTSKHVSFSPSSTSAFLSTTLAGIIDYASTANKVLLEIQQSSSSLTTYYYISYNRVGDATTSINRHTQEGKNQLCIVSKDTSAEATDSMVQAYLSEGGYLVISDFNGQSGETLTIKFTSLTTNNEANVEVVLTGFPTASPFPSMTPSKIPTKAPSTVPSNQPSTNPSLSPSRIPSTAPSKSPSVAPFISANPSSSPSTTPSTAPSKVPTGVPISQSSANPSLLPSTYPSLQPSNGPSKLTITATVSANPSLTPSKAPSTIPSNQPSTSPSLSPSAIPSGAPSLLPSLAPSQNPSSSNAPSLSKQPSSRPSNSEKPSLSDAPSQQPSGVPSFIPSSQPSSQPSTIASLLPSSMPSGAPSLLPSLAPSKNPSSSNAPSVSKQPSSRPSTSEKPSTSFAPSQEPSGVPSVMPSNQPSTNPSLSPSIQEIVWGNPTTSAQPSPSALLFTSPPAGLSAPSLQPVIVTPAPTDPIPVQRTGTIVVEIGLGGLNDLDKICTAIESFLAQGIQAAFSGTNTQTTTVCARSLNRRRMQFKNLYEKPILITVTTTFADVRLAPRRIGFVDFLENLIVSQNAQNNLPQYIQLALGSSSQGVHISLVQTQNKPIMIVSFGDEAPTANPTVGPTTTVSPPTTGGSQTSAAWPSYYSSRRLLSLVFTGIIVGML